MSLHDSNRYADCAPWAPRKRVTSSDDYAEPVEHGVMHILGLLVIIVMPDRMVLVLCDADMGVGVRKRRKAATDENADHT